jgi:glycosyltransferase involved in cell wall biosynthesis
VPKVDVVIPNYNYGRFLPECVDSVLSQGVADLRVLIIDNASEDDSVEVARALSARDPRIEVIAHERNIGPHGSFNEGIDRATADYFMILCADDTLQPCSLAAAVQALDEIPEAAFVLGKYMGSRQPRGAHRCGSTVLEGGAFVRDCCRLIGHPVPAFAIVARTSAQKSAGHYRPALPLMDDLEIALRLGCQGSAVVLSTPLVVQRVHDANISGAFWSNSYRELAERAAVFQSFFSNEGKDFPDAAKLERLARSTVADWAYWAALSLLVRRRRQEARDLFRLAREVGRRPMLIPPLVHLARREGAWNRIGTLLTEVVAGKSTLEMSPRDSS